MNRRHAIVFCALVAAISPAFGADAPDPKLKARFFEEGLKPYGSVPASALKDVVRVSGSRGEIVNFTLRIDGSGCVEPKLEIGKLRTASRFYEMLPFVTKKPSYRGAPVGTHYDPLIQKSRICVAPGGTWILGELELPSSAAAGSFDGKVVLNESASIPLKLKLWDLDMPDQPSVSLYSELTTWFLLLGHYGKWNEGEEDLARKYIRRMELHRMYPIKHWQKIPSLQGSGLDLASTFFKPVVETLPEWARISVPFQWPIKVAPSTETYFSEMSKELKRAKVRDRSFVYLWDEPQKEQWKDLLSALRMAKRAAPDLKVLVTTTYKPELENLVDIFVPVMDQFDRSGFPPVAAYEKLAKKGKEFWLYNSCMSHGCGNDHESGSPDWMIDRPGAHVRVLGWLAHHFGVKNLLYYSVNNGYQHFPSGRDPWVDQWDFSGNGDGTLFYPGRPGLHGLSDHAPIDSLRLKLWRQSSYDADYVQMIRDSKALPAWWNTSVREVVRGIRTWSKSEKTYTQLREKIGDYLDAKNRPLQ